MNFNVHYGSVLVSLLLGFVLGLVCDFLGSNSLKNLLVRGSLLRNSPWQFFLVAGFALEVGHSTKSMNTSF